MKKIFLLGSERSGSNLVRTLLGNHSAISAPIAPHLCDVFSKHIDRYKPWNASLASLYKDIETYINHPFNDWGLQLDAARMANNPSNANFIEVLNNVYSEKAIGENKKAYFSKDIHNHRYALGIKNSFSDVKFVYLYRDPRDQVASWLRTPLYLHTPYQAITKWVQEQEAIAMLTDFYGLEVHFLKYEDLIDDTATVISNTLQFIGLPVEEVCFSTNPKNDEAGKHPLWENINRPIKKSDSRKYKDVLSSGNSLLMVESMASKHMLRLGYSRETEGKWRKKSTTLFDLQEQFKIRTSQRKQAGFMAKDMAILNDKKELIKKIFS